MAERAEEAMMLPIIRNYTEPMPGTAAARRLRELEENRVEEIADIDPPAFNRGRNPVSGRYSYRR